MAETKIGWTGTIGPDGTHYPGFTFNPWRGCTKVSKGCQFCYADTLSARNPKTLGVWGPKGTRAMAAESYWKLPTKWNAEAETTGIRRKVFCSSLADVFEGENTMPADAHAPVASARERLWRVIEATPYLDWLLLTKRPENIAGMMPAHWQANPRHNVWLGTSAEDQNTLNQRTPALIACRHFAANLFLSCEPLLGPINFSSYDMRRLDWIIIGGESGNEARPMDLAWPRKIIADVLGFRERNPNVGGPMLYFKQLGTRQIAHGKGEALADIPDDLRVREWPTSYDLRLSARDSLQLANDLITPLDPNDALIRAGARYGRTILE